MWAATSSAASQASWPVSPERSRFGFSISSPAGSGSETISRASRSRSGRHGDDGDQPVVEGDGGGVGGGAVEGQELALDAVAVALRRLGLGRDAEGGDDGEGRLGAGRW